MKQTPEEKAIELMETFKWQTMGVPNGTKTSAILCVDEIIKANPTEPILTGLGDRWNNCPSGSYWQQVKEELQKM